jgi:hypothetical protein
MALKRTTTSQAYTDLMLAPMVVAARLPILWQEAMTLHPKDRHETRRMFSEKLVATQEGIVAAQVAFGHAMFESWTALAFGQMPKATPRRTAQAMMQASLAPAARKVQANMKRLSGKRK